MFFIIYFCKVNTPKNNASAVGGHPGTYKSMGIILLHPFTTDGE